MVKDGLTDVYGNKHMGVCAETCAKEMNFQGKSKIILQLNHTIKVIIRGNQENFQMK